MIDFSGIRDQITGLKWVQRHIAAFDGDASRVTVFGVSAGGLSTCVLLFSPAARGLLSGVRCLCLCDMEAVCTHLFCCMGWFQ